MLFLSKIKNLDYKYKVSIKKLKSKKSYYEAPYTF